MTATCAVGFDFDHTLGIDNKLERTVALAGLAELAHARGVEYDGAQAEAAIDRVLHEMRGAGGSVESAIAGFYERFVSAGSDGIAAASAFRDRVLEAAPAHVSARPGALEMLERLDALGVPYGLLTNGWSPLQEEKARLIGFRGSVFVSERIGASKPSAAAFDTLVAHFAIPAAQIWYVGDDPVADCGGAAACGLRAVWYDWESRTYPPDVAAPAAVIHSLSDVPALLPCA